MKRWLHWRYGKNMVEKKLSAKILFCQAKNETKIWVKTWFNRVHFQPFHKDLQMRSKRGSMLWTINCVMPVRDLHSEACDYKPECWEEVITLLSSLFSPLLSSPENEHSRDKWMEDWKDNALNPGTKEHIILLWRRETWFSLAAWLLRHPDFCYIIQYGLCESQTDQTLQ